MGATQTSASSQGGGSQGRSLRTRVPSPQGRLTDQETFWLLDVMKCPHHPKPCSEGAVARRRGVLMESSSERCPSCPGTRSALGPFPQLAPALRPE